MTNQTIELIDVLWLDGNAIVAAFEIESTTSIYSGLLRMSDLLARQPNISVPLFLVAPDERREKVIQQVSEARARLPAAGVLSLGSHPGVIDAHPALAGVRIDRNELAGAIEAFRCPGRSFSHLTRDPGRVRREPAQLLHRFPCQCQRRHPSDPLLTVPSSQLNSPRPPRQRTRSGCGRVTPYRT